MDNEKELREGIKNYERYADVLRQGLVMDDRDVPPESKMLWQDVRDSMSQSAMFLEYVTLRSNPEEEILTVVSNEDGVNVTETGEMLSPDDIQNSRILTYKEIDQKFDRDFENKFIEFARKNIYFEGVEKDLALYKDLLQDAQENHANAQLEEIETKYDAISVALNMGDNYYYSLDGNNEWSADDIVNSRPLENVPEDIREQCISTAASYESYSHLSPVAKSMAVNLDTVHSSHINREIDDQDIKFDTLQQPSSEEYVDRAGKSMRLEFITSYLGYNDKPEITINIDDEYNIPLSSSFSYEPGDITEKFSAEILPEDVKNELYDYAEKRLIQRNLEYATEISREKLNSDLRNLNSRYEKWTQSMQQTPQEKFVNSYRAYEHLVQTLEKGLGPDPSEESKELWDNLQGCLTYPGQLEHITKTGPDSSEAIAIKVDGKNSYYIQEDGAVLSPDQIESSRSASGSELSVGDTEKMHVMAGKLYLLDDMKGVLEDYRKAVNDLVFGPDRDYSDAKIEEVTTDKGIKLFTVKMNDKYLVSLDHGVEHDNSEIVTRSPVKDVPKEMQKKVIESVKAYDRYLALTSVSSCMWTNENIYSNILDDKVEKFMEKGDISSSHSSVQRPGLKLEFISPLLGSSDQPEITVNVNGAYNLPLYGELPFEPGDIGKRTSAEFLPDDIKKGLYDYSDMIGLISKVDEQVYMAREDFNMKFSNLRAEFQEWNASKEKEETADKKKVFWYSSHEMTQAQENALKKQMGDVEIVQYNKPFSSAYDVAEKAKDCDALAVETPAPVWMQQQFLKIAEGRPVIVTVNEKNPVHSAERGNDQFVFARWDQLDKIDVKKHDFSPEKTDEPKKVFWFSRHAMTKEQEKDLKEKLGDRTEIIQCDRATKTAYGVVKEAKDADVLAIEAPIQLQQQFLKIAEDRPVIMPVNDRVLVPQLDGTVYKVAYAFDKWEQLDDISIETHEFTWDPDREQGRSENDHDFDEDER